MIRRDGDRLIIEPVRKPTTVSELLAEWREESPLGPEDHFPEIEDRPARPEDIF